MSTAGRRPKERKKKKRHTQPNFKPKQTHVADQITQYYGKKIKKTGRPTLSLPDTGPVGTVGPNQCKNQNQERTLTWPSESSFSRSFCISVRAWFLIFFQAARRTFSQRSRGFAGPRPQTILNPTRAASQPASRDGVCLPPYPRDLCPLQRGAGRKKSQAGVPGVKALHVVVHEGRGPEQPKGPPHTPAWHRLPRAWKPGSRRSLARVHGAARGFPRGPGRLEIGALDWGNGRRCPSAVGSWVPGIRDRDGPGRQRQRQRRRRQRGAAGPAQGHWARSGQAEAARSGPPGLGLGPGPIPGPSPALEPRIPAGPRDLEHRPASSEHWGPGAPRESVTAEAGGSAVDGERRNETGQAPQVGRGQRSRVRGRRSRVKGRPGKAGPGSRARALAPAARSGAQAGRA